eukprot:2585820-Pleurochrysis_carterae.AAC.1
MGVLYIIGQGATVQMASDLSTIGHTTMSHLHQWIDWLVQTQYSKHAWLPETEAQIKHVTSMSSPLPHTRCIQLCAFHSRLKVLAAIPFPLCWCCVSASDACTMCAHAAFVAAGVYEKLGFPGAICSIDGVHIHWARCPSKQWAAHKGKEGCPTRVYNVACDHTRHVLHVIGHSHPGARNDKSLARFNSLIVGMYRDELHSTQQFRVHCADGTVRTLRGLYAIVDGGYHQWR